MKKIMTISAVAATFILTSAFALNQPAVPFSCPSPQQLKVNFYNVGNTEWGINPFHIRTSPYYIGMRRITGANVKGINSAKLIYAAVQPGTGFGYHYDTVVCAYSMVLTVVKNNKPVKVKIHDLNLSILFRYYSSLPKAGSLAQTGYNQFLYYPDKNQ